MAAPRADAPEVSCPRARAQRRTQRTLPRPRFIAVRVPSGSMVWLTAAPVALWNRPDASAAAVAFLLIPMADGTGKGSGRRLSLPPFVARLAVARTRTRLMAGGSESFDVLRTERRTPSAAVMDDLE